MKMNEYFKRPVHQIIVTRPLEISEVASNYDVRCSVKGGGLSGQAGAIILGISKALILHDGNLKEFKEDKLTTRDSRVVERKNTVTGKLDEASSFLRDNHLNLTINKDSDIRIISMKNKINVAVIGATGFTGLDLVLMLSKHPKINILNLCATKNLGKKISFFDKRIKKKLPNISSVNKINWSKLDLVFLSLPNGEAQKLISKRFLINKSIKFIDLSLILEFQIIKFMKKITK